MEAEDKPVNLFKKTFGNNIMCNRILWQATGYITKVVLFYLAAPVVLHYLVLLLQYITSHISRCSFSIMVKWTNDGLLQANASKILVNDGLMLANDGEMSAWSMIIYAFHHHCIIASNSPSLISILLALAWIPSFAHFTIIEKLHRLHTTVLNNHK